jgi:hypothetical protein
LTGTDAELAGALETAAHGDPDPRVRAALERIAAEAADPQVRESAARPLGSEERRVSLPFVRHAGRFPVHRLIN